IVDELVERPRPNREPFGISSRVGRIERRIGVEPERAVLIDLRDPAKFRVIVADAELQVVVALFAGDEPRVIVLDLVVGVPGPLRLGARLRQEAWSIELRRAE